jgi:hypothetical protein
MGNSPLVFAQKPDIIVPGRLRFLLLYVVVLYGGPGGQGANRGEAQAHHGLRLPLHSCPVNRFQAMLRQSDH